MERVLAERAQQMFLLADKECKGFIVKKDMQHMRAEVALSADQLEAVFDSLDVQGNTYLTMQQFLAGFGEYLAVHAGLENTDDSSHVGEDRVYSSDSEHEPSFGSVQEVSCKLEEVLDQLADFGSFGGLQQLCRMVELEGSWRLLDALVCFLQQLLCDLSRRQAELQLLDHMCLTKEERHRTEMLKLCEDMENQIKEKEILARKERDRAEEALTGRSQEFQQQEKHLQQLHHDHKQLTTCVQELQATVLATCQQNTHLATTKAELECDLQRSQDRTSQLQRHLDTLRADVTQERRHYVSSGFQLARNIFIEQQGLTRHLQLLQSISATLEGGQRGCCDQGNDSSAQACFHCTGESLHATHLHHGDEYFHQAKVELPLNTEPCLLEELQSCAAQQSACTS